MNTEAKLVVCKETRSLTAESFAVALGAALDGDQSVSEVQLRDQWLAELQKNTQIFPEGWYTPPPHGMGVLFATEVDTNRVNYTSLRPEEYWPRSDVFLNKTSGIIYVYASPVHRKTGIIGDFGMTVYLGDKPEIKKHIQNCLRVNQEIFDHAEVGMSFADISAFAANVFAKHGLSNEVTSITDPAKINIGHTIPASYVDWSHEEMARIRDGERDWVPAAKTISTKRVFVSSQESFTLQPGMAFTLEPRLTIFENPSIPMSSFHTIIVIHNDGSKELLTNFDIIFQAANMMYMKHI